MKVLLIGGNQFGYLLDYYYYCFHCPDDIQISYLGMNVGKPEIESPNTNIRIIDYMRKRSNLLGKILAIVYLQFYIMKEVTFGKYDLVFIKYYRGCSILRLISKKPMILDIRTASVKLSKFKRYWQDAILRLESHFFSKISIISPNLAKKLCVPKSKIKVIPLGTDLLNFGNRDYSRLHLLYVGTLYGRDIEKTIRGMAIFSRNNPEINWTYDIIGSGTPRSENKVQNELNDPILRNRVVLHGYIHRSRLESYYKIANVGISFVPLNEKYDCQPPTKTFEYIGAGMPVIATATSENKLIVNDINGVLCDDNPESFSSALEAIWRQRESFDSQNIQNTILDNTWERITNELFVFWRKAPNCSLKR